MTTGPSVADIDQIIERIQVEVAAGSGHPDTSALAADDIITRDFRECFWALSKAEGTAQVGLLIPDFRSYISWKRRLARATARIVLFLGQVISMQQREFNAAMLIAVKHLIRPLRRHDAALTRQEKDLGRQQAAVRSLQAEVELLRQRLDQVTTAAGQVHALPKDHTEVRMARAA